MFLAVTDQAAQHDGVTVFDADFGLGSALVGDRILVVYQVTSAGSGRSKFNHYVAVILYFRGSF